MTQTKRKKRVKLKNEKKKNGRQVPTDPKKEKQSTLSKGKRGQKKSSSNGYKVTGKQKQRKVSTKSGNQVIKNNRQPSKNIRRKSNKENMHLSQKLKKILRRLRTSWKKQSPLFRDLILAILGTLIVFMIIGNFFIRVTKVEGFSMIPTLRDGDTVVVRRTKEVERFDLVLFQQGGKTVVRRVIGLPNELIRYEDDILYVDSQVVDEPFIIDEINDAQRNEGQYTEDFTTRDITGQTYIPEDRYLVLGDNRQYSTDSRQWGLLASNQVIGVVTLRLFPINDLTSFTIFSEIKIASE
ncbi:signal peptidase I [Enterococcus sp. HY326]|uniref:signal peptidase I n=1 Tax=Enterococcus sp. HY326 TaxID=2971265 RepID=UPI002ACDA256|nr:signal peptidase I [Enterococcus sp. HY326]